MCWRSTGAVGMDKQFSVWLSILPESLTKTNSTITCAMFMECQSTMTELKVSVSEFCYNQRITMLDEGPKELVPWGQEQPFHIPRNGTGLLSSSSSSSLSIWHHCDLSVFKAEQNWLDFTAGWFSNLVTHLKRRKNMLQKVPYSLSMAVWLLDSVHVTFWFLLRGSSSWMSELYFTAYVKTVGFCCPLSQTWEMLRVYKYYGLCPRRNLIWLFSNLIMQGHSFTGREWFIVSILYKSVKLFFKGCGAS